MIEIEKNSNYATYEEERNGCLYVYTMVNLNDYSSMVRNDYDSNGICDYDLLYEEVYLNDIKIIGVNALLSEDKEYISFVVETSDYERIIKTDGLFVISDNIFFRPNESNSLGEVYSSTLISNNLQISLDNYLNMNPGFINAFGTEFKIDSQTSEIVKDFINSNKEIKNQMSLKKVSNNC